MSAVKHSKASRLRPTIVLSVLLMAVLSALFAGCGAQARVQDETEEPSYRRGKSLLREGRKDEALQAFLSVTARRSDAADSHLEAGLLYLNHIQDPLAALYHFRQYIAMKPGGEFSEFVGELMVTAEKDFAKRLPGAPFAEDVARVELMEQVRQLQASALSLKQALATAEDQVQTLQAENRQLRANLANRTETAGVPREVAPIIIQPRAPEAEGEAAGPRSYTVESGDTLSRISQKVYGSSGRWTEIYEANRDQLSSPNALRVGQTLQIP